MEKESKEPIKKKKVNIKKVLLKLKKIICNKKFLIVVGIIILALLILFGIKSVIKASKGVDYPVIYNNNDADLYLLPTKGKGSGDAIKLAAGESVSNVVYANTTNKYVLFQKNEDLYLYKSSKKGETTKIVDNISMAMFTENDKYIIALAENKDLYVYNYKSSNKIDKDVSTIIDYNDNYILYEKDNVVYLKSLNHKKDDRIKVSSSYSTYIEFSEDGKNVIFIDGEGKLYSYNIKKDDKKEIDKNVVNFYCDKKSCDKMYYVVSGNTKKIMYYDGDKEEIAKDVYLVYDTDLDKKQVVYVTLKDNKYSIYYQKGTKAAEKVDGKLDSVRFVRLFEGKEIYYITGGNEVKYAKIHGAGISDKETLAKNVAGYLHLYKKGYAFVTDVDEYSNGTLYIARNGKAKKIDEKVNSSSGLITVSKKGDKIYYLKNYNVSGDLYYTKGKKSKLLEADVRSYQYFKEDLLYFIKDYNVSTARGNLYRYTGKTVKIVENVTRIASSPVEYVEK